MELNTPRDDLCPTLSADGRVLYYNYDADTSGGGHIWVAVRRCQ